MKPKRLYKHVKEGLVCEIKAAAKKGRFVLYRELAEFASQKWDKEFPKDNQRRLVDYLDAINHDSWCKGKGMLLSIIVVNDDGMPDSGFFRKLKAGKWQMERSSLSAIAYESDEKIFRREAAEVFRACEARIGIHVFMDLENIPKGKMGEQAVRGWKLALIWLKGKGDVKEGHAYSVGQSHKRRVVFLTKHGIKRHVVHKTGNNAADAALLVDFGRKAFRVPARDLVCIMGSDTIYNQAAEIAARAEVRVIRFCNGELEYKPENGFYCAFDINNHSEWNKKWETVVQSWPDGN